MAKSRKVLPARKPREAQLEEHSLLVRSAESLGRVIGALQRQLDSASRRLGSRHTDGTANGSSNGKRVKNARRRKTATKTKRKRTTH